MKQSQLLFTTSGIRGKANTIISPELGLRVGRALVQEAVSRGVTSKQVVVGYDNRRNSYVIASTIIAGITSSGFNVNTFSMPVPTSLVIHTTVKKQAAAGIIVTGSHLPKEDNGLILFDNLGNYFKGVLDESNVSNVAWQDLGKIELDSQAKEEYLEFLHHILMEYDLKKTDYDVLLDPVHGPMRDYLVETIAPIFRSLTVINDEYDDRFPGRISEPTPLNLVPTGKQIVKENLHLGIATDMDGDRVIFILPDGTVITGDYIGAIFAWEIWKENPQEKIVVPINTSAIIEHVAEMTGGQIVYCKVGPPSIIESIRENDAIYGFEETGKYIFTKHAIWPDSAISSIKLINLLQRWNQTLESIIHKLPKLYSLKTKVENKRGNETQFYRDIVEIVRRQYPNAVVNELDGLRINFPDKSWLLIRQSGTEDYVRIFSEHSSQKACKQLNDNGKEIIEMLGN